MFDGLVYGWRSALLSVAIVQLLLLAAALTRPIANRSANRTLALLLVILAGIVTPWAIGFAGFYDRWRWLTFAPFQITLAVAPLIYLYGHALVVGRWPYGGWRHLLPAMMQAAFLTASFALPSALKDRWSDLVDRPYDVVTGAAISVGLAVYGFAGLRLLGSYRRLLSAQRSDDHRFAAIWLSRAIGASLLLLPIWAGYLIWDAVAPLGYMGLLGLYLVIAVFGIFLGIEGWRHAVRPFPTLASLQIPETNAAPLRDWAAQGKLWAAEVRANDWHSDPELSLAVLARRLGTNSGHLSRALNDGLGVNFSTFIGRLRCETIAAALDSGSNRDLLDLALDAGFGSKASFNRAFLGHYGTSPSDYRRASQITNRMVRPVF